MRRSELKRTAFKAKPGATWKTRKPMKKSRPKSSAIRKAARMQACTLRYPVCNRDPETTVLCHSNQLSAGKGMGLKAPDTEAAFGCSRCHDLLDGRMPRPDGMTQEDVLQGFDRGREMTHEILQKMNLL